MGKKQRERLGQLLREQRKDEGQVVHAAYLKERYRQERQRYGKAPPTAPPLPAKAPTSFPPPSKYEERNGG